MQREFKFSMIEIETKSNGVVRMSLSEFARWACLIEAFMFINDKATELGVNPIDMIKPLAVEEYIKERYEAMYYDVGIEYSMGNI